MTDDEIERIAQRTADVVEARLAAKAHRKAESEWIVEGVKMQSALYYGFDSRKWKDLPAPKYPDVERFRCHDKACPICQGRDAKAKTQATEAPYR